MAPGTGSRVGSVMDSGTEYGTEGLMDLETVVLTGLLTNSGPGSPTTSGMELGADSGTESRLEG